MRKEPKWLRQKRLEYQKQFHLKRKHFLASKNSSNISDPSTHLIESGSCVLIFKRHNDILYLILIFKFWVPSIMEMRLTPDQKIAGSTPAVLELLFCFFPSFYV